MVSFRLSRASSLSGPTEVEIEDLGALLAFIAEHGSCIVSSDEGSRPTITIYDDYIE